MEHQKKTGIRGKVLLILDNAPSHPSAKELNAIDKNFEVIFLLANVKAIIQPMNQSPISATKKSYKINLMRKLLIEGDYEKIETFLKELKLRDCLEMFSKGWSNVKQTTLQNAWKPLLGTLENQKSIINSSEQTMYDEDFFNCETHDSFGVPHLVYEFCEHLTKCLSKIDEDNEELANKVKSKIEEWFNAEEGDDGWETLSDAQIVQSVLNDQQNLDDLKSPSVVVVKKENIHEEVKYEIDEEMIDEEIHDFESPSVGVVKIENIHEEVNSEIDQEMISEEIDDFESSSVGVVKIANIHEEVRSEIDEEINDFESPSVVDMKTENIYEEVNSEIDEDEKNATVEAYECFLKFKNWITTRLICSESEILHIREFENKLRNAIENNS